MSLIRSIATVGSFTMISRVTGFVRDILIANFLGAGFLSDVFFVAFKLPNLFRRLFAEGAFNAAFVPLFSSLLEKEGKEKAKQFASEAFSVLAVLLLVVVILAEIFMPWAIYIIAPGFDAIEGKIELAAELSRITFPYLFFISLVSLLAGVLNSVGKFAAPAAAPILLNLTLIASLILLSPITETTAHALSIGVFAAGVIQFLWLIYHARRNKIMVRIIKPKFSPHVKLMLKRILPGVIGAGVYQINLLVDTILATIVASGAVSWLYYADRVNQMPLGVVGVAVSTALLPILSRQIRAGTKEEALHSQNRALEFALFFTIPAAMALMTIAVPIVSVLFERGAFGIKETTATSSALTAFAAGLPAYVLIKVFASGFFAREDTATPVRVAGVALVINIVLNLILMIPFGHVGIAAATAISAWSSALMLAFILKRKGFFKLDNRVRKRMTGIVFSSLIMVLVLKLELYFANEWLGDWLLDTLFIKASVLSVLVFSGMGAFALMALITKAVSINDFKRFRKS